jgi:hypothetical protein
MGGVIRRLFLSFLAVFLLAAPASAGTIVVQLTFAPGKLAVTTAPATATAARPVEVPVTVADGSGSGNGWTLRVRAARSVTVVGITGHCAAHSTCTLPSPVPNQSGNVVLRAARNTGMGVLHLVVTVAALKAGTPATPVSFTVG